MMYSMLDGKEYRLLARGGELSHLLVFLNYVMWLRFCLFWSTTTLTLSQLIELLIVSCIGDNVGCEASVGSLMGRN